MNTAEAVAGRYSGDGQVWEDSDGVFFTDACEAIEEVDIDQNWGRESTRYTFPDGSILVAFGPCWDYGFADCHCAAGGGHDEHYCEAIEPRSIAVDTATQANAHAATSQRCYPTLYADSSLEDVCAWLRVCDPNGEPAEGTDLQGAWAALAELLQG